MQYTFSFSRKKSKNIVHENIFNDSNEIDKNMFIMYILQRQCNIVHLGMLYFAMCTRTNVEETLVFGNAF